jgi:murein L,D-transpeptidase YcbB/YkuD
VGLSSIAAAQEWNPFKSAPGPGAPRPRVQVEQATESLEPFAGRRSLEATRAAAETYRRIAANGGWPAIQKGQPLRGGDSDARVPLLRARLAAEGYGVPRSGTYLDGRVEAALKDFQQRHGLRATGTLTSETLGALNVPAEARANELARSVETIAGLQPHTTGRHYVLVNVPSFELQAVDAAGRLQLYSRVVVGKPSTQTPDLHATIRAVDFMPYWHVPPSIAQRAIIPAIQRDPSYLERERIRVFSAWGGTEVDPSTVNWFAPQATRYVFRQDPGLQNALGLIRIDMPNKHTVYLHDTPLKRLFDSHNRALSAGCVRVQNVFALAGLLIGEDEKAVRRRLEPLMLSGERMTLKLEQPVPVHFTYLTGWSTGDGPAHFRDDLYGREVVPTERVAQRETDPWHTRVFDLSP